MRLCDYIVAGVGFFVATVVFLTGCSNISERKVLDALPRPIMSIDRSHFLVEDRKEGVDFSSDNSNSNSNSRAINGRDKLSSSGSYPLFVPAEWVPFNSDRSWDAIVIHHSATEVGSAEVFDKVHRSKGWDELGYHFVIGNGSETPDGFVEVGSRWKKQKHGAHCKTVDNHYNDYGIGICLVGNFESQYPSPAQLQSLRRLVVYLANKYNIPADRVLGHREVEGTNTRCPGRNMPLELIRSWVREGYQIWASAE